MSSEWRAATLAEIALTGTNGLVDGPFGSNLPSSSYTQQGIPVIRGSNLTKGKERFKSGEFVYVSSQTAEALSRSCCIPGDIIFTKKGTLGQIGLIPSGGHPVYLLSSNQMRLRVDATKADREFVYYYLAQPDSIEKIIRDSEHTGVPKINLGYIKSFPIALPTVKAQRNIAATLSALDDRITLLRETNATLEAIAQALFKSWFVDFDPVRAKMESLAPEGMDEATAALFPDGLQESELGLIPRGWWAGTLGAVLKLRNERVKPSEYTASLPYVPIENITAKVPFLQEFKSGADANSSLALFKKEDVLFGAMRPYFHKVCSAPFDGVTRTTVFTLTPVNSEAGAFALFQAYQDSTIDYATQHSEGSTIPYAKWKNSMELMPLLLPPVSVQAAFSAVVSLIVERGNSNVLQAQTLANLRDNLLPRLISGQLRLPESDALVEETLA